MGTIHGECFFRQGDELNFDAMDAFIAKILAVLREYGGRAVRVFPPEAGVLLSFAERIANEVVCRFLYVSLVSPSFFEPHR